MKCSQGKERRWQRLKLRLKKNDRRQGEEAANEEREGMCGKVTRQFSVQCPQREAVKGSR